MNDHRPTADPGPGFALPPGLRFPYAIGRPGPNESTGPRAVPVRGGGEGVSVRRAPVRGLPGPRPGADESTGPRAVPVRGGGEGVSVRRAPVRGLPGPRPGPSRIRAVDSVAAAFLAGEPRPGAVPRGARRAWFDVPDPRHR